MRGRFWRNEKASVAILAAVGLTAMAGVMAFAVDLSYAYMVKGRLQNAADAAALAVAQRLPSSEEEEAGARLLALSMAQRNVDPVDGQVSREADVAFGRYHSDSKAFQEGQALYNAVRVTARRAVSDDNPVPTFFGGLLGVNSFDLSAVAIAMKGEPATCLYALDPVASAAVELAGNSHLSAPNCGLQVNSSSMEAAVGRGNASIDAASTCVVGNYSGSGFAPPPVTGCPPKDDPLADVPEPDQPGPCYKTDFTINKSQVLPANRTYCGKANFSGNADITLEPGVYYFKDADLDISSASFIGEGVLIFLDANSSFHVSGNGVHRLSAAEDGPHAGVVIFQSRAANNPTNKKSGTSVFEFNGAMYMPSSTLDISGTGGVQARPGKVKPSQSGGQGGGAGNDPEQGEGQGGGEGEAGGSASQQSIDFVIARRFHVAGNASFQVGPPDGAQTVARSMLVY